jgi:hypothetical protein
MVTEYYRNLLAQVGGVLPDLKIDPLAKLPNEPLTTSLGDLGASQSVGLPNFSGLVPFAHKLFLNKIYNVNIHHS